MAWSGMERLEILHFVLLWASKVCSGTFEQLDSTPRQGITPMPPSPNGFV